MELVLAVTTSFKLFFLSVSERETIESIASTTLTKEIECGPYSSLAASEKKALWLCLSNENNISSVVSLPAVGKEFLTLLMGLKPTLGVNELIKL